MMVEDNELLIRDLCARLSYNVKAHYPCFGTVEIVEIHERSIGFKTVKEGRFGLVGVSVIKPYLRKLSSITEEELEELNTLTYHNISVQDNGLCGYICGSELEDVFDWLNKKMFAYRYINGKDMFELGVAIEAPEGMYEFSKEI